MYIVVVLLLGLGSINSQNNMLFFAFGLALAGALVSGIISGGILMNLQLERLPPRVGSVGAPLHVGYIVRNRSRWLPAFAVGLQEVPRRRRRAERAGELAVMPVPRAFVAGVGTGAETRVESIVVPVRRGLHTFHAIRASTSFPLGITRKSVTFVGETDAPAARCVIRPEIVPITSDFIRRAVSAASEGERSSPAVGMGDEFFSIREYVPGDNARQIAWRPSARSGTLLVRENAARSPMRVWVALVPTPGGAPGGEIDRMNERAISLAASIIARASEDGAEVGLAAPLCGIAVNPRGGVRHAERLLDMLAALDLSKMDVSEGAGFPHTARSAAWIVVHAGERRPPRAPARAVFVSAARPESVLNLSNLGGSPTWR